MSGILQAFCREDRKELRNCAWDPSEGCVHPDFLRSTSDTLLVICTGGRAASRNCASGPWAPCVPRDSSRSTRGTPQVTYRAPRVVFGILAFLSLVPVLLHGKVRSHVHHHLLEGRNPLLAVRQILDTLLHVLRSRLGTLQVPGILRGLRIAHASHRQIFRALSPSSRACERLLPAVSDRFALRTQNTPFETPDLHTRAYIRYRGSRQALRHSSFFAPAL